MIDVFDLEIKLSVGIARLKLKKLEWKMTKEERRTSKLLLEEYRHGYDLFMGVDHNELELSHAGHDIMMRVIEYVNEHDYTVIMKPWTFVLLYPRADDIVAIVPSKYQHYFD